MLPREYFYTAIADTRRVSKKEFQNFIKNYPRHLELDVNGISEPPCITYNDFQLANRWPYSIVAQTFCYDDDPNDYYYCKESERKYLIVVNYNELWESKTGRMAEKGE